MDDRLQQWPGQGRYSLCSGFYRKGPHMCFEKLQTLAQEKLKKATIWDFGIMKVCLIAFTLMVAKLWSVVLALAWGWYAAVFAVTYAYLLYFFFIRK